MTERSDRKFKLIATRCGGCGCGCPTVLESDNPDELVIVGKLNGEVLKTDAVKKHVGENEIAVVIPKDLLLEAARKLV